jgi:hypothetical protein
MNGSLDSIALRFSRVSSSSRWHGPRNSDGAKYRGNSAQGNHRTALVRQGVEPSQNHNVRAFFTNEREKFSRAVTAFGIAL